MEKIKFNKVSKRLILSEDLNYSNTLFGGRLLQWLDEAASLFCIKHMDTERIVTLKLSEMIFEAPGVLSDMLGFYLRTISEGKSSLKIELFVYTEQIGKKKARKICHCEMIFVAVDKQGKPSKWIKKKSRNDWMKNNFSYLP